MGWHKFITDIRSANSDEEAFVMAQDYILSGHTD